MSSFREMKDKLDKTQFHLEIYKELLKHLETNYRLPTPKYTIVTEDRIKVPDASFEEVSIELTNTLRRLEEIKAEILEAEITEVKSTPKKG